MPKYMTVIFIIFIMLPFTYLAFFVEQKPRPENSTIKSEDKNNSSEEGGSSKVLKLSVAQEFTPEKENHIKFSSLKSKDIKNKEKIDNFNFIDVYALDKAKEYILSDPLPIFKIFMPEDMFVTMMSKKQLPSLGTFKILERKEYRMETWYNVSPFNEYGEALQNGWLRSNNLLRQKLKIKEEKAVDSLQSTDRTKAFSEILSSWKPLEIEEGGGLFHVHMPHQNLTKTIYNAVLQYAVCIELLYKKVNLSGIDKIIVTNRKKDK